MKRLLLILLTLAACRGEPQSQTPISPCRERAFEGSAFVVCDPGEGMVRLYSAAPSETPARRFAELRLDPAAVAFAMNAGMFDEAGRPIGLAIEEGREEKAINRREGSGNFHLMPNGVFLIRRDGRAEVVTSADFEADPGIAYATQSGPMLVVGGTLHPKIANDGESRYVRNAVGVTAAGKPLFVITLDAVSLGKLARFFRDDLGTPNALYLDGSVSSLWDPANGRMDDFTELGPMLVAFKPSAVSAPRRAAPARP